MTALYKEVHTKFLDFNYYFLVVFVVVKSCSAHKGFSEIHPQKN